MSGIARRLTKLEAASVLAARMPVICITFDARRARIALYSNR